MARRAVTAALAAACLAAALGGATSARVRLERKDAFGHAAREWLHGSDNRHAAAARAHAVLGQPLHHVAAELDHFRANHPAARELEARGVSLLHVAELYKRKCLRHAEHMPARLILDCAASRGHHLAGREEEEDGHHIAALLDEGVRSLTEVRRAHGLSTRLAAADKGVFDVLSAPFTSRKAKGKGVKEQEPGAAAGGGKQESGKGLLGRVKTGLVKATAGRHGVTHMDALKLTKPFSKHERIVFKLARRLDTLGETVGRAARALAGRCAHPRRRSSTTRCRSTLRRRCACWRPRTPCCAPLSCTAVSCASCGPPPASRRGCTARCWRG